MENDLCRSLFVQIISALKECHSRNIIHRNIKLENILLDTDFQILLSGFGLSGTSGYSGSGLSGTSGYSGVGLSGTSGYSGAGLSGTSG
jgi:serine/threonine protein kinase